MKLKDGLISLDAEITCGVVFGGLSVQYVCALSVCLSVCLSVSVCMMYDIYANVLSSASTRPLRLAPVGDSSD